MLKLPVCSRLIKAHATQLALLSAMGAPVDI